MSNKFTPHDFGRGPTIQSENAKPLEPRVVKLEIPTEPVVSQYHFGKIKRGGEGDYNRVREKFGPLAATDVHDKDRAVKDRRFSVNPLLRDPLSIEDEERRVIEQKVQAEIVIRSQLAEQKGFQAGYEAGLKKGHAEAYDKFSLEGEERLKHFDHFLDEVEQAKSQILKANEHFLIEMIYQISKMITLKELTIDNTYILRLAEQLITQIGVKENVKLRIHPSEQKSIEMLKGELESKIAGLKNLRIETSEDVKRGGCIVETEWNEIDASIENQLHGIRDALLGHSEAL